MPEEKEAFLKKGEIRTMQKDIIRLQEEEVLTERERIARLKTGKEAEIEKKEKEKEKKEKEERKRAEEEAEIRKEIIRKAREEERKRKEEIKREEEEEILEERRLEREKAWQIEEEERKKLLERLRKKEVEAKRVPEKAAEVLIPRPVLKKPSLFEKIFIRIIVIGIFGLLIVLVISFWYWYFKVREVPPAPPPPVEEVIPEERPEVIPEEKPEITIPSSLVSVETTEILEISKIEEIPENVNQILAKEIKEGSFSRILIKNLAENRLSSLSEIFAAFQIKTPENFFQKLGENYTFFIFSQEAGKRLGFIVEIKEKEGLSDLLKSWEPTMEKDFENFFALLGKEKPALSTRFKDENYEEINFRFQTFTSQDLGICYSIFNNYFLLTSSWESFGKTIDGLTF